MTIVHPDFIEWSKNLVDKEDAAIALEQAFNQGRALGLREGSEIGWQKIWDANKGWLRETE